MPFPGKHRRNFFLANTGEIFNLQVCCRIGPNLQPGAKIDGNDSDSLLGDDGRRLLDQ